MDIFYFQYSYNFAGVLQGNMTIDEIPSFIER